MELGSGTGVAGIAAAACGAESVLLTDMFGLELLAGNIERNGLTDRVNVAPLAWDNHEHIKQVRAMNADVNKSGSWDVIIGSDVLYDKQSAGKLLSTMEALSDSSTVIYIASPSKNIARYMALPGFQGSGSRLTSSFDVKVLGDFSTPKNEGFRAPGSCVGVGGFVGGWAVGWG